MDRDPASVDLRARALDEVGPLADLDLVERGHLVGAPRPLLDAQLLQPRHGLGLGERRPGCPAPPAEAKVTPSGRAGRAARSFSVFAGESAATARSVGV